MDDGLSERIRQLEQELDALPEPKATWFLEPERTAPGLLAEQVALAASSPIVDAILKTWSGAVAVLNSRREVVALNAGYLQLLGVEEPEAVLGLRPGEALRCVHANDLLPGGCGTGPACRTCGAAISILTALEKGGPVERDCAFTVNRDGALIDSEFRVRAQALDLPPERFILLSLVDVSVERRRAALERAFFHDLANLLHAVVGACEEMDGAGPAEITIAAADARELAALVAQELRLQRALMAPRPTGYEPAISKVPLDGVLDGLDGLFHHHPVARGKRLEVSGNGDGAVIETDPYLLRRVVTNMLVNAFEATPVGGEVRLIVEAGLKQVGFRVWNDGVIPAGIAPRIFQRYFSTKGDEGRGQGTFVMKFFGEQVLGGKVGFTSTREVGTTFTLLLPRSMRA
ncbi:MAG TPA: sensor histidine kinase [Anaeromyxobacteraceae bacterium]|nr:sensor histidine kinase [Anaeromyxobacteraceae bacterium]